MNKLSKTKYYITIFFICLFLVAGVASNIISPSKTYAVNCQYSGGSDPKWTVYDFVDCPVYGGGTQLHYAGKGCNTCGGQVLCGAPTEGNPDPGAEVRCEGEGGSSTPDKDIIWQRVFTDDYSGNIRFFGNVSGVPNTITYVTDSNFKDKRVNMAVRKEGTSDYLPNIWSGRFCALSPVYSVDSWGRPRAVKENGQTSESADFCCSADGDEAICTWDAFTDNFCTACKYDKDVNKDFCLTPDVDGCEQLSAMNPTIPGKGSGVDRDEMHPINKIWDIINHQQPAAETANRAMNPWLHYDKTYTVTTLKTVENTDHKAHLIAPDGYFCYKAVVLRRSDEGGFGYNDPRNFRIDSAFPDQSRCNLTVEPEGGGTYALWQVKKSLKGRVVGTDGTNVTGIQGATVMFWVGNNTNPSTYQYAGESTTDAEGNYFFNNPYVQDFTYYNVKVVSSAPAGYSPGAVAVRWDNPNATSGSIPHTWNQSRDTRIGEDGYYVQATFWDNDCSSNKRDGSIEAGRCVFAFRKIMNQPPTCTIQYQNSSGNFVPYDNNLEWAPNTSIRMKTVATDPEGDFISSYTFGHTCGTSNFVGIGGPGTAGQINYITPNSTSASCTYSSDAADSGGSGMRGPICSVTVKTKAPNAGSMYLSSGAVLSKISRTGDATAHVRNYSSATENRMVIQPTGICAPSAATCVFASTSTNSMPIPQGDSNNRIIITLKNNPFGLSRGGLHHIHVLYEPTNTRPSAAISVIDANPACTGLTFAQTMPTNNQNIQFRIGVTDDWSVSGFGVDIKNSVTNALVQTIVPENLMYFSVRNPVTMLNDSRQAPSSSTYYTWNNSTEPTGTYRVDAVLYDTNNQKVMCSLTPIIRLDKTAPTCTNLRITNAVAPSDLSPLQISSNAIDVNSRIRKVRYIVAPASAGDVNLSDSTTWKYNQEFNMSNFATQVIGSQQTFTTPLSNSWITNNNLRGIYTVYAQWEDEAGNVPNGTGGCKVDFELGTRYRVKVLLPSDDPSGFDFASTEVGGDEFKFIAKRNAEPWPAAVDVSSVGALSPSCIAVYPDGNASNDHGEACNAFFLTDTVFGNGNTSNIGVQIPKYLGTRKYSCESITVNGTTYTGGQLTTQTIAGSEYCVLTNANQFTVTKGTYPADPNIAAAYPTLVKFRLSYNTDAVVGRLFNKNGVNVSDREITSKLQGPPVQNGPNAINDGSGLNRYFIVPGGTPLDSGRFWPVNQVTAQFTPVFSVTKVAADDEMCFYTNLTQPSATDIAAAQPPLPKVTYDNISNLIKTRDAGSVLRFNDSCTVSDLTGRHGRLSPLYQNQISMLIAPRMRIGSTPVTYVDEIGDCNQPGNSFPASFEVRVILTDSTTGTELANCDIDNPACQTTISNITLNFKHNYSVRIGLSNAPVTLNDFVICDEDNLSRTNPYLFSPVDDRSKLESYFNDDNNDYGTKYPKLPGGSEAITTPIKFALKENNKWYQVYNGGVHNNSKLTLSSNTDPNTEGMPSQAVLVGDPTGVTPVPKGYNMYTALPASNPQIAGGLVSSYDYDPVTFGQFGLTGIPNVDNWHTVDMVKGTNKIMQFDNSLVTVFQAVKNNATAGSGILGYSVVSSLNNALTTNKSYYKASGTETLNSVLDYSGVIDKSVVTFIDFSNGDEVTDASGDSSNVFVISSNIITRPDQSLIIYVNGNVEVDYDVTKLNSVTIVSTGTITYVSKGEDQDVEIDVRGAMYGKLVVFERDLNDAGLNLNPAQRILYDNRLVNFSKESNFASEITESRIYWILKE